MGSTTPPWRSFDAPSVTTSTDAAGLGPASPGAASPSPSVPETGWSATGRILATIAAAAACAVIAIVIATSGGTGADVIVDGASAPIDGSGPPGSTAILGDEIVVEIVGAVSHPGVYRLSVGARTGDLVAAAGGYGPRVDLDRAERELNLAEPLRDGLKIRVPSRDDPSTAPIPDETAGAGPTADSPLPGGLIDLNRATSTELESLPGIGPVTAGKIIASREEAPFAAVEDLRTRGLVGEKTFEKIRATLTAG